MAARWPGWYAERQTRKRSNAGDMPRQRFMDPQAMIECFLHRLQHFTRSSNAHFSLFCIRKVTWHHFELPDHLEDEGIHDI